MFSIYADDILLYHPISSTSDCRALQADMQQGKKDAGFALYTDNINFVTAKA